MRGGDYDKSGPRVGGAGYLGDLFTARVQWWLSAVQLPHFDLGTPLKPYFQHMPRQLYQSELPCFQLSEFVMAVCASIGYSLVLSYPVLDCTLETDRFQQYTSPEELCSLRARPCMFLLLVTESTWLLSRGVFGS